MVNYKKSLSQPIIIYSMLGVVLLLLVIVGAKFLPTALDWHLFFRPAVYAVFQGESPYTIIGFFNPPWTILPITPFALIPEPYDRAILFLVAMTTFAFVAHRLGADKLTLILFITSPPVVHSLMGGNLEWLVMLAFIMPAPIAPFFAFIKPQMGATYIIFLAIHRWRTQGWLSLVTMFLPVAIVGLLFVPIVGWWPFVMLDATDGIANASMWPLSIPIGLVLLIMAVRYDDMRPSLVAGPLLTPYVMFSSYSGALAALLKFRVEFFAVWLSLWVIVLW